MQNIALLSGTLQSTLNRLFQGYNLSEMGENDERLKRAELFDDYLILTDLIKTMSEQKE
jgi:hypothetical protein